MPETTTVVAKPILVAKPELTAQALLQAGFKLSSRWLLSADGTLSLERPLPRDPGVYTMVKDGHAIYVGLATMGLAKRLHFYRRPGTTQRTSQRINKLLKAELQTVSSIDIYTATPVNLEWNGLPVSGIAGLELGMIQTYFLAWNIRGV